MGMWSDHPFYFMVGGAGGLIQLFRRLVRFIGLSNYNPLHGPLPQDCPFDYLRSHVDSQVVQFANSPKLKEAPSFIEYTEDTHHM